MSTITCGDMWAFAIVAAALSLACAPAVCDACAALAAFARQLRRGTSAPRHAWGAFRPLAPGERAALAAARYMLRMRRAVMALGANVDASARATTAPRRAAPRTALAASSVASAPH